MQVSWLIRNWSFQRKSLRSVYLVQLSESFCKDEFQCLHIFNSHIHLTVTSAIVFGDKKMQSGRWEKDGFLQNTLGTLATVQYPP